MKFKVGDKVKPTKDGVGLAFEKCPNAEMRVLKVETYASTGEDYLTLDLPSEVEDSLRDINYRAGRFELVRETAGSNEAPSYRSEVLRTCPSVADGPQTILCASLGLAGESGEFVDLLKKHLFHGHPFDREKLILELGDIRWYLELAAHALGVSMEEVEKRNVEKLRKRYPDGFDTAKSIKREAA